MSEKEINRVELLALLNEGKLSQVRGVQQLGLSARQVRRLLRAYREGGAAPFISKKVIAARTRSVS